MYMQLYNTVPLLTCVCVGMGDPAYFYVTLVFLLNGAMMSLFYIYGTYLRCASSSHLRREFIGSSVVYLSRCWFCVFVFVLSGSKMGGGVTVLSFFFNHGEVRTRTAL